MSVAEMNSRSMVALSGLNIFIIEQRRNEEQRLWEERLKVAGAFQQFAIAFIRVTWQRHFTIAYITGRCMLAI